MHIRTILRNILSTWFGYLVTILTGFLLAPFVVHHLGNTGYGVWTLVASLTGYFGMLDIGIRQSVSRFVARYIALKDDDNVNRTVNTAFMMLGCGGGLALLATLVINLNFGAFQVEAQFAPSARMALLIAGVNIAMVLPMSVFSATLIALERFDVTTGISVFGTLTRTALVVFFLSRGHGIVTLALITLIVSAAEYSLMATFAKRLHRSLRISWNLIEFKRCRELFGFGVYRFVWIVANQLIFYSDTVVIGIFLNAGAITYFAIAGSLINYGRNIISLATDTLYPAASRLDVLNDRQGLRDLLIRGTQMGLILGLPMCLGFVFLGKQFISLWMGPAYASSALFLLVLTIPQFVSMSQYASSLILVAMAKHQPLAWIALVEGLANLALSILLVRKLGLVGVAWGTAIPHMVTTIIVLPLYTLRTLDLSVREYIAKAYVRPLLSAIPIAGLTYLYSILFASVSWLGFAAEVGSVVLLSAILTFNFCLPEEQKIMIRGRIRGLFDRSGVAEVA